MKSFIKTYGCQMNEQDSLHMKGLLGKMGYGEARDYFDADIIVLSTCSIREKAVNKVYSELGRLRELSQEKPHLILGLAGCVAQQEKGNLLKRFPHLDLVFGPDAIKQLPEMVEEIQERKQKGKKQPILQTKFDLRKDFEFVNLVNDQEENRIKAFVNIQKGCDNVCSFCIVPRVRGAEVSRPHQDIIDEIKTLVDMGVKEVTLLGQNVNSYGLKHEQEISFVKLLERIAAQTQLQRLRFTTSHPKDVGPDLIALFGEIKMLTPYFHLPVQSGSNRVLEVMRRQYTREHYLDIVRGLREVCPDIVLSTDFIVGFPGEEAEEFEETIDLLNQAQFDSSFSFAYSPRPGTRALNLEDHVPLEEKKKRLEILQTRQKQIAIAKNQMLEGCLQEVLVEDFNAQTQQWMGRSLGNKIIHFAPPQAESKWSGKNLSGETLSVRVTKAHPNSLVGELIND